MFEYLCKKSVYFYCVYFLIVLQHHLAVKICPSLRNFNLRSNYTVHICCVMPKQKGFSFAQGDKNRPCLAVGFSSSIEHF